MNSLDQDLTIFVIKCLMTKAPDWGYEKEWRLLIDSESCGEKWDDTKHGALLDSVPPLSITLGCEAENDFEVYVKNKCKANGIRLYKMVKNKKTYGISRVAL